MLLDYIRISTKGIFHRKLRSWLTMIGIFIGIAAVVSLISLGKGLELAVAQQFNLLGVERINIQAKGFQNGPPGTNVANPLTENELDIVRDTRGVSVAAARLVKPAIAEFNDEREFVYVTSLPEEIEDRKLVFELAEIEIEIGHDLKPSDRGKVIVGSNFYHKNTFGKRLEPGDKVAIQGKSFSVVGVSKKTGSFTVDTTIQMNEDDVRELFNDSYTYGFMVAKASDINELDAVADRIRDNLRDLRGVEEGKEDFVVETSQQAYDSLKEILNIVTILLVGIAGISLFVGGIGIANTMYTSVLERTRDIGIMKAVGARNSDLLFMFMFESGMLGLAGGIVGVIGGVAFGTLVEFVGTVALGTDLLKASFSFGLIAGSLLFAFIVGALAGTAPAYRASKMNIVDALRSK